MLLEHDTLSGDEVRDIARRLGDAGDLAAHDAYRALDAAGVLLRPGLTGTNVMDVVFGVALVTQLRKA